jgi:hypothetical protein
MTTAYGFGFDFARLRSREARIARLDALATLLDAALVIPSTGVRFIARLAAIVSERRNHRPHSHQLAFTTKSANSGHRGLPPYLRSAVEPFR